jgi:hypothetical protein
MDQQGKNRVGDLLSQVSTEAARKTQLDVRLHFVPINVKALERALSGKITFTSEELREAYEVALKAIDQPLTDAELRILPSDPAKRKREEQRILEERANKLNSFVFNYEDLRSRLVKFIVARHKNHVVIVGKNFTNNGRVLTAEELRTLTPCVVYEGTKADSNIIGALYGGYRATQSGLFTPFLNTEIKRFIDTKIYADDPGFSPGFDVGHILGDSRLTQTALGQKILNVYEKIDSLLKEGELSGSQAVTIRQKVDGVFNELKSRSSYGKDIEATLTQDTRGALLAVDALIVIVQERVENQKFYGSLIEGRLGGLLGRMFTSLGFSKSLKEVFETRVRDMLQFGKVKHKGTRKTPVKVIIAGKKNAGPVKVKTSKDTGTQSTVSPKKRLPTAVRSSTIPADFMLDLLSIQNIINNGLSEVIKRNMGDGSRKDILNLRTGRFADSAKVIRMTESRQGAITAFYTYMKNPYATFSTGGRQQFPRTRDPKLLVTKSIRELVQAQVANRLRAVAV